MKRRVRPGFVFPKHEAPLILLKKDPASLWFFGRIFKELPLNMQGGNLFKRSDVPCKLS